MKRIAMVAALATLGAVSHAAAETSRPPETKAVERGRYVVKISGCNDCHTPGYLKAGGKLPENQWLAGDRLGFRGAWGTTYPANLRLFFQGVSESQWVQIAKNVEMRPPMPSVSLHAMSESDLRSVYQFIRTLGPAGEPAPAFVPPDREPMNPYLLFIPQSPK